MSERRNGPSTDVRSKKPLRLTAAAAILIGAVTLVLLPRAEIKERIVWPMDTLMAALPVARMTFSSPDSMKIRQVARAIAVVRLAEELDQLTTLIPEGSVDTVAKISERMHARLTGPGFEIQEITSGIQAVSLQEPTQWSWTVRPLESGQQVLQYSLSLMFNVRGTETERTVWSKSRTVVVAPIPLWRQGLTWFLNSPGLYVPLILGVVGLVLIKPVKRWRERRNKERAVREEIRKKLEP